MSAAPPDFAGLADLLQNCGLARARVVEAAALQVAQAAALDHAQLALLASLLARNVRLRVVFCLPVGWEGRGEGKRESVESVGYLSLALVPLPLSVFLFTFTDNSYGKKKRLL